MSSAPSTVAAPHTRCRTPRALWTVGLGAWLICLAAAGLLLFHQSDYFHHVGAYPHGWVGYTPLTFTGLVAFLACGGVGVGLLLRGAVTLSLAARGAVRRRVQAALGGALVGAGGLGWIWGRESMKCLVVLCLDTSQYVEVPHARPEAGLGFLSILGMRAFFLLGGLGVTLLVSAAGGCRGCRVGVVPGVLCALVLLALTAVVSFYVPNSWEYFVASRIANSAQLTTSTDAAVCGDYLHTTCPEVPWAWMRTTAVRVSSTLVLKLYPSNLIFFSYLGLFLSMAFLLTLGTRTRRLCQRTSFPFLHLCNGELGFTLLTVAMLVLFFVYWHHDHNYNGYWQGGTDRGVGEAERWGRSLGQLAVACFSLLMFPASRFSLLHAALGTSWESSLWAHKVLGYAMLAATLGHMLAWYIFYYQRGDFPHDVFAIPPRTDISKDNFTVPLISLATWFLLGTTGVFALWPPLRRRAFALFYSLHLLGFLVVTPAVLWHAAAAWEYLLPGLTVYALDVLSRLYYSTRALEIDAVRFLGDVAQVTFRFPMAVRTGEVPPGAFVFLNVPEVSVLEWHPFSLVPETDEGDSVFSLYVKPSSRLGSWTGRLGEMLRRTWLVHGPDADGVAPLMVSQGIAGGTALRVHTDYHRILFIAGGVGITPCYALMHSVLIHSHSFHLPPLSTPTAEDVPRRQTPYVQLIWSARDRELLFHFEPKLQRMTAACPLHIQTKLFSSQEGSVDEEGGLSARGRSPFERGRPDLALEVDLFMAAAGQDEQALIFVCGPEALVQTAKEAAAGWRNATFHSEAFLL